MARAANLSPLGLYEWDNTLFDLMQIPSALNKDTLVKNLIAETAELEVLYPNPVVLKNLIGVWSAKNIDVWNRLYDTTQYDYDPIENYNRYEEGSDSGTGRTTHSGTDGRTESITSGGMDTTTGADTKGHWIAGFDAPTPTTSNDGLFKQTRDQDDATTQTNYGRTESIQESRNYGQQVATSNEGEHTLHAHGNIGVTTTQTMILQQREIDLFNIYDIIIEDFKMRFCILVY